MRGARCALLPANAPDLLICDLSLPDMDGIEFMQAAARSGFRGAVMLLSGLDRGRAHAAERLASAHGLRVLGSYGKPLASIRCAAAVAPLMPPAPAPGSQPGQ